MTINALLEVISPPEEPLEAGSPEDWSKIEEAIGTALPQDYKDYINTFGNGQVGGFIWPANPFSSAGWHTLMNQIDIRLDALRVIKEKWGERECPYPLYPEPNGLLPWGYTDNGDTLYWQTTDPPDQWTVVINESRGPDFEQYNESMTDFLAKLLLGEIPSKILPVGSIIRNARFEPMLMKDA